MSTTYTPRIYVGTYDKSNSGSISGEWLDIEDYADAEDFLAACAELHKDESDPEFMFQDMEDIPEGMAGESFVSGELFEWASLEDDDRELLSVYREDVDGSGTLEQARDAFHGVYDSAADYAQSLTEDCHKIPEYLQNYIDWESMARDMGFEGYSFVAHGGMVWVFSS